MSGVAQRVAKAGKQIASNPQVKAVVEQATEAANTATNVVSKRYEDIMRKNSKFVIGDSPSFYVTKENVRMHALYTTLAEYALICRIAKCPDTMYSAVALSGDVFAWPHGHVVMQHSKNIQKLCEGSYTVAPIDLACSATSQGCCGGGCRACHAVYSGASSLVQGRRVSGSWLHAIWILAMKIMAVSRSRSVSFIAGAVFPCTARVQGIGAALQPIRFEAMLPCQNSLHLLGRWQVLVFNL